MKHCIWIGEVNCRCRRCECITKCVNISTFIDIQIAGNFLSPSCTIDERSSRCSPSVYWSTSSLISIDSSPDCWWWCTWRECHHCDCHERLQRGERERSIDETASERMNVMYNDAIEEKERRNWYLQVFSWLNKYRVRVLHLQSVQLNSASDRVTRIQWASYTCLWVSPLNVRSFILCLSHTHTHTNTRHAIRKANDGEVEVNWQVFAQFREESFSEKSYTPRASLSLSQRGVINHTAACALTLHSVSVYNLTILQRPG